MQPENQRQAPPFAITVGEGRTNPQGIYTRCEPSVVVVADILRKQPATIERWWSMHLWTKNKRSANAWLASCGILIDIDYRIPKVDPPPELVTRLTNAAATFDLPGNFFHTTPHGGRIALVYEDACTDRELQKKAERGAGTLVAKALEQLGLTDYQVDSTCLGELARYFYTPDSVAKGVKRSAQIIVMRTDVVKPADLAAHDVAVRPVESPPTHKSATPVSQDMAEALEVWNRSNPGNWPRHSAPCPVCGDEASFGHLPEDPARWYCFSSDHSIVGVKGDKGWHGDALDLEAHRRGCKPIDVLRSDGYLAKRVASPPPRTDEDAPFDADDEAPSDSGAESTSGPKAIQPVGSWHSRSYCTVVQMLEQNARDILEGRRLELNEMSGDIELGRQPIKDANAHRIRYLIEAKFKGGIDKQGNQIGMQFSTADVFAAITQVSSSQPYHPVREYLSKLIWDEQPHIALVLKMLNADDTPINQIILKRFFISAVARALKPGCKVDTVFILVGKQGAKKSSFFRALADPWFVDTTIDIASDPVRAYMTMRKAWLLEWAELESLFRAKNASTAKAFLSSPSDSYVPKHARYSIDVKRSGIIVGTINPAEFLSDDTGHRRFHPLTIGNIDLESVIASRDQIWAEAVHLFNKGEYWWLTEDEERLLAPRHGEHEVSDIWAGPVMAYVAGKPSVSVQDVLGQALCIAMGQWTDRDMKRVARVLKSSGEWKADPNKVKGQPRLWLRTGAETGVKKDE